MKPCNIFQLQRLSVNDGEGIRTTIFFKGCDLRCRWCANPESWSFEAQTIFFPHKCTACGNCLKSCLHHANKRTLDGKIAFISLLCQNCKACIVNCPNNARQSMGSYMSITEVISEIKKDLLFYEESGGGITLSGGEPLLHTLYIAELMQATTKLGIDVALDRKSVV